VTPRFGSGAIPAKGGRGYNTYQYQNPEADRLLAEGASSSILHSAR
jgi:peptide/nickel transport system substrate-binding protein